MAVLSRIPSPQTLGQFILPEALSLARHGLETGENIPLKIVYIGAEIEVGVFRQRRRRNQPFPEFLWRFITTRHEAGDENARR
jgi:hypothetical protein